MSISKVAVVGAGLVGSAIAIYLARLGLQVELFERRPDIRKVAPEKGRSINLALSHRGIRTLNELGLEKEVLSLAVPVYGRAVHINEHVDFQAYSHFKNECNYAVDRGVFNEQLINAADAYKNILIHFSYNFSLQDCNGFDFVIAADGASSHLRRALQGEGLLNFTENKSKQGYKEFFLKPKDSQNLDFNHLHIWPRLTYMFMALPNYNKSFTGTLFLPMETFAGLTSKTKITEFFNTSFAEVINLIPDYLWQFQNNKTSQLNVVQGTPWLVDEKILFIGDAAHAMLPYLGQGMNCGLEDCRILNNFLHSESTLKEAFIQFAKTRKKDTDAITELSRQNFEEMSCKVVDEDYLKERKRLAKKAAENPEGFRSHYELITYTSTPYSEILNSKR